MDLLPLVFTSGWASGVNAYLVVLLLGLADRAFGVADVPDALGRWEVLTVAALLYALEFVVDKVPYLDSAWDGVSTAVRPTIGAALGLLLTGDASSVEQALAAAVGGSTAFASHVVKAGIRAGINTSPEPASNIGMSLLEDVTVTGVVLLALAYPWVALGVAGTLLAVGLVLVAFLFRTLRRAVGRRGERRADRLTTPTRW